jgi:hypothetical protein
MPENEKIHTFSIKSSDKNYIILFINKMSLEINKEFLTGLHKFRDIWVQSRKFKFKLIIYHLINLLISFKIYEQDAIIFIYIISIKMAKTVAGKISGVLNRKSFLSTLNVYCMKLRGPGQKLVSIIRMFLKILKKIKYPI